MNLIRNHPKHLVIITVRQAELHFEDHVAPLIPAHMSAWCGAVSGSLMYDLRDLRLPCWQRALASAPLGATRESELIKTLFDFGLK